MKVLLIDDVRKPVTIENTHGIFDCEWVVATNFQDGINALKTQGPFDLLCLDHDLASWDSEGRELTGYDIMLFLEENPEYMPNDVLFVSANPAGVVRMQACLKSILSRK